jgi:hypothetical protein
MFVVHTTASVMPSPVSAACDGCVLPVYEVSVHRVAADAVLVVAASAIPGLAGAPAALVQFWHSVVLAAHTVVWAVCGSVLAAPLPRLAGTMVLPTTTCLHGTVSVLLATTVADIRAIGYVLGVRPLSSAADAVPVDRFTVYPFADALVVAGRYGADVTVVSHVASAPGLPYAVTVSVSDPVVLRDTAAVPRAVLTRDSRLLWTWPDRRPDNQSGVVRIVAPRLDDLPLHPCAPVYISGALLVSGHPVLVPPRCHRRHG